MKHIGLLSALGVAGAVLSMSTASLAAPPPPAPAPAPQPYTTAPPPTVVQPPRPGVTAPQAAPPQPVVVAPQPTAEKKVSYTGTNVPMLATGLGLFGLSYAPALVVGATSSLGADRNLYLPVAGPWIDLANRPSCGGRGPSCGGETTNKILLATSGVAQGVGAAMTLVGLLVPVHHETVTKKTTTAKSDKPTIQISPSSVGSGYGLSAVGTW